MKKFKAESKRLLDMMINSIYTHKEIFIRELISNSSDAIDKIYYKELTDDSLKFDKENYYIRIEADKENRILKISDTGIGMTKEELENNLGTIAKSGSLAFKSETEMKDGHDIIGQFGVGFYSAFMVADVVTVISKQIDSEQAYLWESKGVEGYSIKECDKDSVGTEITLKIKENTEDENYDEYLDENSLRYIIKKYSDFISYPIKMDITESRPVEGAENEYEEFTEEKVINSMVPIWRKNKSELKVEDYEKFYSEKQYGFDKPLKHLHISVDGAVRYNSILFIPESVPFNYYSKDYEKGLELYSNGVMIMSKCKDLVPDYFGFIKGMVDSEDLSLNISREMLQHDRQLKIIAKNIKSKIKNELKNLLKNDREKYVKFFDSFGNPLKQGLYESYGQEKEVLQDLLMFYSSKEKKMVTLDEYVESMPEEQKYIYYASGDSIEKIEKMPQIEIVMDKDYEILFFTDEIDEFTIKMLMNYKEKEFKSVSSGDLGIEEEDNENSSDAEDKENNELFVKMNTILAGKVKAVRDSKRLKNHPVCLSNEGEVSIEMEKIVSAMPDDQELKADKILEINTNHQMFKNLKEANKNDEEKLILYTNLLYNQALMIEGLPINDPLEFSNDICKIMI